LGFFRHSIDLGESGFESSPNLLRRQGYGIGQIVWMIGFTQPFDGRLHSIATLFSSLKLLASFLFGQLGLGDPCWKVRGKSRSRRLALIDFVLLFRALPLLLGLLHCSTHGRNLRPEGKSGRFMSLVLGMKQIWRMMPSDPLTYVGQNPLGLIAGGLNHLHG